MASRILSVKVTGENVIKANLDLLTATLPEFVAAANLATANEVLDQAQRNIKDIDAIDTGDLFGSGVIGRDGIDYQVAFTSKHAPYIEFGTSPHFPPLDAIRAWCARKGIPVEAAYPIARAISERGTPERPFLYPAFLAAGRYHVDRMRAFVALGLRDLLGRAG